MPKRTAARSKAPVIASDLVFLGAAQEYLLGVRALHEAASKPALAFTFLAGHTLECALKAFLSKAGFSDTELEKQFGHDIRRLWGAAHERGLPLLLPPPDWVNGLSSVYSPPIVRYPMDLNGVVGPNMSAVADGVEQVVATVRRAIRGASE
jgi:hypothetical protein